MGCLAHYLSLSLHISAIQVIPGAGLSARTTTDNPELVRSFSPPAAQSWRCISRDAQRDALATFPSADHIQNVPADVQSAWRLSSGLPLAMLRSCFIWRRSRSSEVSFLRSTRRAANIRSFCSRNLVLMTRVYTTYVRPILEYCSYIWSPYTLYEIDDIERVQSYFTRRLLPNIHPYNSRLAKLKIDSLEERRIKIDLGMYFKILNNMIDLDSKTFFKIAPVSCVTRGHNFKLLKIGKGNNDKELYAFYNRQIDCWNSLPSLLVESPSFSSFNSRLKEVDLSRHCSGRVLASMWPSSPSPTPFLIMSLVNAWFKCFFVIR